MNQSTLAQEEKLSFFCHLLFSYFWYFFLQVLPVLWTPTISSSSRAVSSRSRLKMSCVATLRSTWPVTRVALPRLFCKKTTKRVWSSYSARPVAPVAPWPRFPPDTRPSRRNVPQSALGKSENTAVFIFHRFLVVIPIFIACFAAMNWKSQKQKSEIKCLWSAVFFSSESSSFFGGIFSIGQEMSWVEFSTLWVRCVRTADFHQWFTF